MTWDFERKVRAAIHGPVGPMATRADTRVIEREGWFQRITPSSTNHNEVLRSAVEEADAERVIDEVVAEYRALGKPTRWFTGPWTRPGDFGDRLLRRGFRSSPSLTPAKRRPHRCWSTSASRRFFAVPVTSSIRDAPHRLAHVADGHFASRMMVPSRLFAQ